ncbi:alpha/beta-hydrolase [Mycena galopus ATCC 62051]|nr:alpha/beta-hydrolase [Mycena galopus ATCC 62051]
MQALTLTCLVLGLFSSSFASPVLTSRSISSSVYDDLVLYTQYSSAAYQLVCPSPLGTTLVQSFSADDGTSGFISRDDDRKEIVVAFQGTFNLDDVATDIDLFLVPFMSPGITESFNVHAGFLAAYNAVADTVLTTVKAQVAKYPSYTIIVTGHSLGGALAALGGVSIKTALPNATLKIYTFGQPRTGDAKWAAYVDATIGVTNVFRGVHTFDGVPTIIPRVLGYEHHSTQYWQFEDPILLESPPSTVTQCVGDEDSNCSDSIPSTGINVAHLYYFGQVMAVDPLLCV